MNAHIALSRPRPFTLAGARRAVAAGAAALVIALAGLLTQTQGGVLDARATPSAGVAAPPFVFARWGGAARALAPAPSPAVGARAVTPPAGRFLSSRTHTSGWRLNPPVE